MLLDLLLRVVINAIALVLAVQFVPDVRAPSDILKLGLLAIVFGLINAYLRPIVKALSLPLTIVTFGLVGLVINALFFLMFEVWFKVPLFKGVLNPLGFLGY